MANFIVSVLVVVVEVVDSIEGEGMSALYICQREGRPKGGRSQRGNDHEYAGSKTQGLGQRHVGWVRIARFTFAGCCHAAACGRVEDSASASAQSAHACTPCRMPSAWTGTDNHRCCSCMLLGTTIAPTDPRWLGIIRYSFGHASLGAAGERSAFGIHTAVRPALRHGGVRTSLVAFSLGMNGRDKLVRST